MRFLLVSILFLSLPLIASVTKEIDSNTPDAIPLIAEYGMGGWDLPSFAFPADVNVYDGIMTIGPGDYLTGAVWKGEPPARMNYEIEVEARRRLGNDFLLGLTVPIGDDHCTWVCGGWGGRTVGISDIDGQSADSNETTREMDFENNQWYRFKIRVTKNHIQCWIDGKSVIDVNTKGKRISMRPGRIEQTVPLGISTYDCQAEFRNMTWRNLAAPTSPPNTQQHSDTTSKVQHPKQDKKQ